MKRAIEKAVSAQVGTGRRMSFFLNAGTTFALVGTVQSVDSNDGTCVVVDEHRWTVTVDLSSVAAVGVPPT